MNIKNMPYKEYYYNFEIDCIKQAFPIIDSLKYSINEYQNINLQDKEQIKTYAKDFKEARLIKFLTTIHFLTLAKSNYTPINFTNY